MENCKEKKNHILGEELSPGSLGLEVKVDPGRDSVQSVGGHGVGKFRFLGVAMTQVLGRSVPPSLRQQESKKHAQGLRGRAQVSSLLLNLLGPSPSSELR